MKSRIEQDEIHASQRLPQETWHDKGLGWRRGRNEQIDPWNRNAARIGRGTLREHLIGGHSRHLQVRHGSDVEPAPANIQVGSALTLAEHVRNRDPLGSETLRSAHLPTPTHFHAGRGNLRYQLAFGNIGAIVLTLDNKGQAESGHRTLGLRRSQTNDLGHGDFASVNGKAHRQQRRRHRHQEQHQCKEYKPEKRFHGLARL